MTENECRVQNVRLVDKCLLQLEKDGWSETALREAFKLAKGQRESNATYNNCAPSALPMVREITSLLKEKSPLLSFKASPGSPPLVATAFVYTYPVPISAIRAACHLSALVRNSHATIPDGIKAVLVERDQNYLVNWIENPDAHSRQLGHYRKGLEGQDGARRPSKIVISYEEAPYGFDETLQWDPRLSVEQGYEYDQLRLGSDYDLLEPLRKALENKKNLPPGPYNSCGTQTAELHSPGPQRPHNDGMRDDGYVRVDTSQHDFDSLNQSRLIKNRIHPSPGSAPKTAPSRISTVFNPNPSATRLPGQGMLPKPSERTTRSPAPTPSPLPSRSGPVIPQQDPGNGSAAQNQQLLSSGLESSQFQPKPASLGRSLSNTKSMPLSKPEIIDLTGETQVVKPKVKPERRPKTNLSGLSMLLRRLSKSSRRTKTIIREANKRSIHRKRKTLSSRELQGRIYSADSPELPSMFAQGHPLPQSKTSMGGIAIKSEEVSVFSGDQRPTKRQRSDSPVSDQAGSNRAHGLDQNLFADEKQLKREPEE
ncbi:hypothetical protein PG987_012528 [Apiospora arundinis]|uniref:Uncharacterized protein n=1 Tax=Apiospora arundinis TaxID=335852 RepID=A0ABR2IGS9_9PEZI